MSSASDPSSPETPAITLTLDERNPNRGTSRGRRLLTESLQDLGAGRSILVDRDGRIIAGNKTWEAAQALGVQVDIVPTDGSRLVAVQRTDLDLTLDPEARRLSIADNRIAELDLDWDPDVLAALHAEGLPLDDLFSSGEMERLLGHGLVTGATPDDAAVVVPDHTEITHGDLFVLGDHRLLCGDATDASHVRRVLGDQIPSIMITDPPYGVEYDPAWRQQLDPNAHTTVGQVAHDDRVDWRAALQHFPGDVVYVWHAGIHAGAVAVALEAIEFEIRAQIIWLKQSPVLSRGAYHWRHEPCYYAVRHGRTAHWSGDRTQTTVWETSNANPFDGDITPENAQTGHPTQKPVALWERAILNHTERGDAIYDPFVGSGTAVIAAHKTGRRCLAIEWEPRHVDAVIRRWQQFSGGVALKVADGAEQ